MELLELRIVVVGVPFIKGLSHRIKADNLQYIYHKICF
jgi:hypothetical protein